MADSTSAGPVAVAIRSRSLEVEVRRVGFGGSSRLLDYSSRWLRRRRKGMVAVGRGRRRGRVGDTKEEGSPGIVSWMSPCKDISSIGVLVCCCRTCCCLCDSSAVVWFADVLSRGNRSC